MKTSSIYRRTALVLTLGALAGLGACGGGGGGDSKPADTSGSAAVTALKITDNVVGTGVSADAGKTITVHYTGWLYDVKVANLKGTQFDTSVGKNAFSFKLGAGQVIAGWDQGVAGMKVGGKRTLVIPSALGYGAQGAGNGVIPANAALVFDVELLAIQ